MELLLNEATSQPSLSLTFEKFRRESFFKNISQQQERSFEARKYLRLGIRFCQC